jgi:hypothetical protein
VAKNVPIVDLRCSLVFSRASTRTATSSIAERGERSAPATVYERLSALVAGATDGGG